MSTVGIKELKNRLTHYLRQTKKGAEIVVTERGKPIAVYSAYPIGQQNYEPGGSASQIGLGGAGLVACTSTSQENSAS